MTGCPGLMFSTIVHGGSKAHFLAGVADQLLARIEDRVLDLLLDRVEDDFLSGVQGGFFTIGHMELAAAMSPADSAVRWPIVAAEMGVMVSEPSIENASRG